MKNLDKLLSGVRGLPTPPGLASMDGVVLTELDRMRMTPRLGPAAFALAISMALLLGVAGAAVPGRSAGASPPLSPFDSRLAFAPSTLLSSE